MRYKYVSWIFVFLILVSGVSAVGGAGLNPNQVRPDRLRVYVPLDNSTVGLDVANGTFVGSPESGVSTYQMRSADVGYNTSSLNGLLSNNFTIFFRINISTTFPADNDEGFFYIESAANDRNGFVYRNNVWKTRLRTNVNEFDTPIGTALILGQEYDVAILYSASNMTIYINGTRTASNTSVSGTLVVGSDGFTLNGMGTSCGVNCFPHNIRDFAIWNTVLNHSEIGNLSFGGSVVFNQSINILTPGNNSIFYFTHNYVEVNVSASLTNFTNMTLSLYNSSDVLIGSNLSFSNRSFVNFTGLSIGAYYLLGVGYNVSGSNYSTGRINFNIYNLTAPSITAPSNGSSVSRFLLVNRSNASSTNGVVNINQYSLYMVNSTGNVSILNYSIDPSFSFDLYLNNYNIDTYFLYVEANDTNGNKVNSSRVFFNHPTNALLNITAVNLTTGLINVFSINISGVYYNTTNGFLGLDIIKNNQYNMTFDASNYSLNSVIFNSNSSALQFLNITLFPSNAVFFTIYNESNGFRVVNLTTVNIVSPSGFYSGSSNSSGVIFVQGIAGGSYTATFMNSLFANRQLYITVENRTFQFIDVYLLNNATTLLLNTKNTGGNVLSGVTCLMRSYVNGTLTNVSSGLSDVSGQVQFVVASNKYYDFNCSLAGYRSYFFYLDPVLFSSYDVPLSISSSSSIVPTGYAVWSPSSFRTNTLTTFNIQFISPYSSFVNYSFIVTFPSGNVNGSGTSPFGSTISRSFSTTGTYADRVTVFYEFNLDNGVYQNFTYSYPLIVQVTNTTLTSSNPDTFGFYTGDKILLISVILLFMMAGAWIGLGFPGSLIIGAFVLTLFFNNNFLTNAESKLFIGSIVIIVILFMFRGKQ